MNTKNNFQHIWYVLKLPDINKYNDFLYSFKNFAKSIKEKKGNNSLYFPENSSTEDFSKILVSVSNDYKDLFESSFFSIYNLKPLEMPPIKGVNLDKPFYSDKLPFIDW